MIPLTEFDNNELKTHQDEMSLILMINKIQGPEDFHEFLQTALDYFGSIYKNTSDDIRQLILDVIWGLMMKIKVPEEKATKVLAGVREGEDMGVLFENFQTYDWEGVNEELEKTKAKLKEAEARADRLEKENRELREQKNRRRQE